MNILFLTLLLKIPFTTCECVFIVGLSLLTMTNSNQICEVLLFMFSKMADETNLSIELHVTDRTIEV